MVLYMQAAPDTLATLSYVSKLRPAGTRDGVLVTATWEQPHKPLVATPAPSIRQEIQRSEMQMAICNQTMLLMQGGQHIVL